MTKKRINLYTDAFVVRPEVLPFRYVLFAFIASLIVFGGVLFAVHLELEKVQAATAMAQQQQQQLTTTLQQKQAELAARKPDPQLEHSVAEKKELLEATLHLVNYLKENALPDSEGFSGWLSDLAYAHQPDISLQQVELGPQRMKLSGVASRSDSVPHWMSGFTNYAHLKTIRFATLHIQKDKAGQLLFELNQQLPKDPMQSSSSAAMTTEGR